MTLPVVQRERQKLDQALALTLQATEWEWRRMVKAGSVEGAWDIGGHRLTGAVDLGRVMAAKEGAASVPRILAAQGLSPEAEATFRPLSLMGVASDGRALESLMYQALYFVKAAMEAGASYLQALTPGEQFLQRAVSTQVADAWRTGTQVQSSVTPAATLMVRAVNPGACSRCVVLAGKTFTTSEAFLRHPQCRCINVPTDSAKGNVGTNPRDYFNSLTEEQQNETFTIAGAQAIRDGADMGQVINARRGMSTVVSSTGQKILVTTEGTRKGGYAHSIMSRDPELSRAVSGTNRRAITAPRLMPETIYQITDSREEAIRLLRKYGYL